MKFIPLDKMSKRDRDALNKQKRVSWDFKPTLRVKESAKIYNRKRIRVDY